MKVSPIFVSPNYNKSSVGKNNKEISFTHLKTGLCAPHFEQEISTTLVKNVERILKLIPDSFSMSRPKVVNCEFGILELLVSRENSASKFKYDLKDSSGNVTSSLTGCISPRGRVIELILYDKNRSVYDYQRTHSDKPHITAEYKNGKTNYYTYSPNGQWQAISENGMKGPYGKLNLDTKTNALHDLMLGLMDPHTILFK